MVGDPIPKWSQAVWNLLNLDLCTSLFEGFLQCFGFVLANAFLNGLGSTVNKFLGLFQTEACEILDSLYDGQFLGGVRNTLQDNVKGGLLLNGCGGTSGGTGGYCDGCCCGFDTVLLFQDVS